MSTSFGAPPTRVSAQRFDPARAETSGAFVTGPLADWLDQLAEPLEVVLASAVVRIAHDDERVSIRFDSGESLSADRVIVTVAVHTGYTEYQGADMNQPAIGNTINTLAFINKETRDNPADLEFVKVLQTIAKNSGGTFKTVSDEDMAR